MKCLLVLTESLNDIDQFQDSFTSGDREKTENWGKDNGLILKEKKRKIRIKCGKQFLPVIQLSEGQYGYHSICHTFL